MTAMMSLEPGLQALIDDRLDAIDRVLLRAGVSRGERRSIVEEVEVQVFELLSRKTGGDPTRVEVASVLAALDPPEMYAPEPYRQRARESAEPVRPRIRRPQPSLLALGSAMGGVITGFLTLVLTYFVVQSGLDELTLVFAALLFPAALTVTACGVLAIVRIRRSDGWLFGLRAALFAAILFPLILGNGVVVLSGLMFEIMGLLCVTFIAVMACNAMLVYHLWKLVAADYRRATPEPG